jgi:hypothetical protein
LAWPTPLLLVFSSFALALLRLVLSSFGLRSCPSPRGRKDRLGLSTGSVSSPAGSLSMRLRCPPLRDSCASPRAYHRMDHPVPLGPKDPMPKGYFGSSDPKHSSCPCQHGARLRDFPGPLGADPWGKHGNHRAWGPRAFFSPGITPDENPTHCLRGGCRNLGGRSFVRVKADGVGKLAAKAWGVVMAALQEALLLVAIGKRPCQNKAYAVFFSENVSAQKRVFLSWSDAKKTRKTFLPKSLKRFLQKTRQGWALFFAQALPDVPKKVFEGPLPWFGQP